VLPLEPRLLGVPSGVSKMIFEPMVHLAQIVQLSGTTVTISPINRNEIPHDPHHLGVPSGPSKMISEPMVRSMQNVHLSCVKAPSLDGPKRASR
jgi:hypothetical protein